MTPEREGQIREWVSMRYGKDATEVFNALGELLEEIDSLRESLAKCERTSDAYWGVLKTAYSDAYPDRSTDDLIEQVQKLKEKNARTEDHSNADSKPRGIRGGK